LIGGPDQSGNIEVSPEYRFAPLGALVGFILTERKQVIVILIPLDTDDGVCAVT
jgi:hypothetical protein